MNQKAEEHREESEKNEDEILKCPNCGSMHIREEKSELICQNCGMVLDEERVAEEASPRAFSAEERERKERTGRPITYTEPGRGMRTEIGKGVGNMQQVSPSKRGQYYRMRKWQKRFDESRDRRMQFALRELERLADVLNLPESLKEEVGRLYEKALEEEIVKGRKIENIVAALVYVVARNQGIPRTLSEISDETGIDERELGKNYRYVARELDLRIIPVNPEDFLPRFAGMLDISGEAQALARKIVIDAREQGLVAGRSPDSVVASAIYLSSKIRGESITQTKIAQTVGVTEVTVRKGYQHLLEGLGLEDQIE